MQEGKKEFFNVTFSHGDNGQLVATNANGTSFSASNAEKDSIITFTATPNENYEVEAWTITGGVKIQGGTPTDKVTKVKVTSNVNVKITFKKYLNNLMLLFLMVRMDSFQQPMLMELLSQLVMLKKI
ncbi:MAG: InlB B-repeat-containing protein, partial [Treponema sp.]